VADYGIVRALNNGGKGTKRRWNRMVTVRKEVRTATADIEICRRRMDNFLDIGTIEVIVRPSSERWESELIPDVRAVVC